MGVQLRQAAPTDRSRVGRFLAAMDSEGLYQRHFQHGAAPSQVLLDRIDVLDQTDRVAVLAIGNDGEVVGHGEYVAAHGEAEFALMVLPLYRTRGIGRRLLRALLVIAAATGQHRMHGMIQAGNRRALQLVRSCGFGVVPGDDATVVIVSRDLMLRPDTTPARPDDRYPFSLTCHDFDRTPLYRRSFPRTALRAGGGQVQRVAADAFGGG